MRYEKPIVVDLSMPAKAAGQEPESCINGGTPAGPILQMCQTGGNPNNLLNGCSTGPQPGGGGSPFCVSGNSPITIYCMTGTGAASADTCTSGPTPV